MAITTHTETMAEDAGRTMALAEQAAARKLAKKAGIPYLQAKRQLQDAVTRKLGGVPRGAKSGQADVHGYIIRHFHPSRADRRYRAHEDKVGRRTRRRKAMGTYGRKAGR